MNLGSSKKWCELLLSGTYKLNDGCGLHWEDGSFSPVGVLEDFITKEWKSNINGYQNMDGNLLIASKECLKKVKAKTNLESVDGCSGLYHIVNYIQIYYEFL